MSQYLQALYDLTSSDNFKRKVAELAIIAWVKNYEPGFKENLVIAIRHEDLKIVKAALVVIRFAIKHHSWSDLVQLAIQIVRHQDSECENLSVLCCAEGLTYDYLLGGRFLFTLIDIKSQKSLKILTCFFENLESINQVDFELLFNYLKSNFQVPELIVSCMKCLKVALKFTNPELIEEYMQFIYHFVNHEDPLVRSESLEVLLDYYELTGTGYFQLSPLIRVLKFDLLNNRFMATEILLQFSVELTEEVLQAVFVNLKEKELWDVSIEFLRKSFERSDEHIEHLLNRLENDPVLFLAVLSAVPSGFMCNFHIEELFLCFLASGDITIVKKAVFSLFFNQNWCMKLKRYLDVLQVLVDLIQRYSIKIKVLGIWAVLHLSDHVLTSRQAGYLIEVLFRLESGIENIQIRWLAISNLLKQLSKSEVFKFLTEKLLKKIEKKSKCFEFYSIIHCLNTCLSLVHPEFKIGNSEIRRVLNTVMNFPSSVEILQFFEILEGFYSDSFQRCFVLINLYKVNN